MTAERESMTLQEMGAPALGVEERRDEAPGAGASHARPTPDPEVVAKPKRRKFTAQYRLRILEEAEAVEVESRVAKQVRGALLDLLCHDYPKKLLLLLPVHMSNAETTAHQCRSALRRFLAETDFRVVVLHGHGSNPMLKEDVSLVRAALRELRAVDCDYMYSRSCQST